MSLDLKAGLSTICRRGEHKTCAAAKARCACSCHAPRRQPVLRDRTPYQRGETAAMRADVRPRKEDAECCNAKRDDLGRLPIGYCGPECERRPR